MSDDPIGRDEFRSVQEELKDMRAAVESIEAIRLRVEAMQSDTQRILLGLESRFEALEEQVATKGLDS